MEAQAPNGATKVPSQDQNLSSRIEDSGATTANTEQVDTPSAEAEPATAEPVGEQHQQAEATSKDKGEQDPEDGRESADNSMTFAPNRSLQNQGDSLLYIQNSREYQEMQAERNSYLLDKVTFLMDQEPDQPESEDLDLS